MGKLRIRARLGTCGRCGGKLGNPLTHVCVTRADRPRRKRRTKIRPSVSVTRKCGTCGKQVSNPLTHTCTVKTDFRRKMAASKRTSRPGRRKPPRVTVARTGGSQGGQGGAGSHQYRTCGDESCERRDCMLWREARAEGYADGRQDGYTDGHQAGYREGYKRGYDAGHAAGQAAR